MIEGEKRFPVIDTKRTGARLRKICREYRISVRDIQAFAHLASNQAVYSWFNGKALPSVDNFFALSRLTGIPIDNMIIEQGNENNAMFGIMDENGTEKYQYYAWIRSMLVRLLHYDRMVRGRRSV